MTKLRMRELIRSSPLLLSTDTTSNFRANLSRTYNNVVEVNLISACIPLTYYNVHSGNGTLYYGATSTTVTPGDFTADQLLTTLQTSLLADTVTFPSGGVTVTRGVNTNKITISATNTFVMNLGTNTTNSIAPLLGFLLTNRTTATSHVGQGAYDLAVPKMIRIGIQELPGGDAPSGFLRSLNVPLDTGEILYYDRVLDIPDRTFPNPLSLSSLRIILTDETGTQINLNGGVINLILELVVTS